MALGNKKVESGRGLSLAEAKIVSAVIGPTPGKVILWPIRRICDARSCQERRCVTLSG